MKTKILILIICLSIPTPSLSSDIYVDGTMGSDCVSGNYSITSRDCSGSDGIAYRILEDALDNMQDSDDIYLRGGTYTPVGRYNPSGLTDADFYINHNIDGTPEDHCSIQSFPGEWAVLESSGARGLVLGHKAQEKDDTYRISYWDFSRFEVDGNGISSDKWAGIGINGEYNTFKYLYIHDNTNTVGTTGTMAGLLLWVPQNTTVKYNYFRRNGCTSDDNNCAQIDIVTDYSTASSSNSCSGRMWLVDGPLDWTEYVMSNEFAYNYFDLDGVLVDGLVKYKSQQVLTAWLEDNANIVCSGDEIVAGDFLSTLDLTNKDNGDDWHHNLAPSQRAWLGQDFVQFHSNIIGDQIKAGPDRINQPINAVIYNNTIMGYPIKYSAISSSSGWDSNVGGGQQPLVVSEYNNILASPSQVGNYLELSFLVDAESGITGKIYPGYFNVTNNYLYDVAGNSDSTHQVRISNVEYTLSEFDSAYSFTNYIKPSSEGSDNLFMGTSGANQYITRGEHSVGGANTIADSGADTPHPYISGVTIPSYMGATNPGNIDDNNWVDGLMSNLTSTAWLRSMTLGRDENDDPIWLEGSTASDNTSSATFRGTFQ